MRYKSVNFTFSMKEHKYRHTLTVTGAEIIVGKLQRSVLKRQSPRFNTTLGSTSLTWIQWFPHEELATFDWVLHRRGQKVWKCWNTWESSSNKGGLNGNSSGWEGPYLLLQGTFSAPGTTQEVGAKYHTTMALTPCQPCLSLLMPSVLSSPATSQDCISAPQGPSSPAPATPQQGESPCLAMGAPNWVHMFPGRWLKPGVGAAPRSHSCPAPGLAGGIGTGCQTLPWQTPWRLDTGISKESSCPKPANPGVDGKYLNPSLSKVPRPWG